MSSKLLSLSEWKEQNQKIDQSFPMFFLNESYSDVIFFVGPERKRVVGHKLVISTCSYEFYNIFNLEGGKNELTIVDVTYETFLCFLEFCYKGTVDLDGNDEWDVLKLAHRFEVEALIKVCDEYMCRTLNTQTAPDFFLKSTHLPKESFLKKELYGWMYCHFHYYWSVDTFNDFPYEKLREIAQMDNLMVDEMFIFDVMVKWAKNFCEKTEISKSTKNIRKVLGDIFYDIRFPIMKIEWIREIMDKYPELLSANEHSNIVKFIKNDSQKCDGFNSKMRVNYDYGPIQMSNPESFIKQPGTLERVACCSGDVKITEMSASELFAKFKCKKDKNLVGIGYFRANEDTQIISCTFEKDGSAGSSHDTIRKAIFWPLCWEVTYKEEYFIEEIHLNSDTWYTMRLKFNEKVPILHSPPPLTSFDDIDFSNGKENNVIPYLLFG